ncbi:hypothetical protein CAEBREN_12065 [Caenorhabditis brenneri]|uniref:SGNH domain-containing protein n=1 Tax=Caenorhabditis brenneri TaxID=135651 RepID=G0NCV1_CAEBE|nr:hypothetical protein CAEBREN_12065 [Caenorhabditis brenneri]
MYKDMLSLIQTGELCTVQDLRISNEDQFLGDKHIDFLELDSNRVFRQAREFQSNRHLIQYYFTNRAMREDLEKTCLMIEATDERPDVVIINSAIWDISRFPSRVNQEFSNIAVMQEELGVADEYFNRVAMFLRRMRVLLPPSSTVVWVIMPPSATPETFESGFIALNHLKFFEIRQRLLDANARVAQIVRESGFDVLDLSFHFRLSSYQVFRVKDGVHFNIIGTRYMNQLLLGHLTAAWQLDEMVMRRWPQNIVEKTLDANKSEFFQAALDFLQDRNDQKHMNEEIQQSVRSMVLEDFRLPYPPGKTNGMTIEQLHQNLRVILMFMKYNELTAPTAQYHAKAFSQLPVELSRFSQEDIDELGKIISETCAQWKGFVPSLRLAITNKRPMVEKTILLPTPPPSTRLMPPGVRMPNGFGSNGRDSGTDTSSPMSISSNSTESGGGTPTSSSGIPNRIADAEPPPRFPKKKARFHSVGRIQ